MTQIIAIQRKLTVQDRILNKVFCNWHRLSCSAPILISRDIQKHETTLVQMVCEQRVSHDFKYLNLLFDRYFASDYNNSHSFWQGLWHESLSAFKVWSWIRAVRVCTNIISALFNFYGPEAYLMHLVDGCQFLNCSVRMGAGVWSGTVHYEFTTYFMGERGGGSGGRSGSIPLASVPDPGGQKTCRSGGPGSKTLITNN
jgi:hypothetical protein